MNSQKLFKDFSFWNRKTHIHLGLFLLLFMWLFSFSGLLLNHGEWKIASFWEQRKETETVTFIHIPESRDSITLLKSIRSQVNIAGEVNNVKLWPDSLHFSISRPGQARNLRIDLRKGICIEKKLEYNIAGKIRTLHTFNGVNKSSASLQPNWLITQVWKLSMDGVAIALVLLCVSSWIMWYKIRERYSWGLLAMILGFAAAIYFVFIVGLL
jgi:hypothetical protein